MIKLKMIIVSLLVRTVILSDSCFHTQLFTFFEGDSSVKNWITDPGYQFILTWKKAQPSIKKYSYILTGFNIPNPNRVLSYTSSLQSVSQSGAIFYFNPTPNISEYIYVQFSFLILRQCSQGILIEFLGNFISIQDLPLNYINNPNRTGRFQEFFIPYGYNSNIGSIYIKKTLLSSVTLSTSKEFFLQFYFLPFTAAGYNFRAVSPIQYGCTFIRLKVTNIFVGQYITKYDFIFRVNEYNMTTTQITTLKAFFPNASNNCFIGLSDIVFQNLSIAPIYVRINIIDGKKLSVYNQQFSPINIIHLNIMICIAKCKDTQFPVGINICSPCSDLNANCYSCNSSGICLTCITGYTLKITTLNQTCLSCYGQCLAYSTSTNSARCANCKAVKGGCTLDPQCIEVDTILSFVQDRCIACTPGNNFAIINGVCKCRPGYYELNNLCINVVGCVTAVKKDNAISCYLCNQFNNYQQYAVNNKCICKNGFISQNYTSCVQVCGDGLRSKHNCDDGNLVSGDGCSYSCQIEADFDCIGEPNAPSVCVYIRENIQLELVSIKKTHFKNEGVIKFKISPSLGIYGKIDASSINLYINRSYTSAQIVFNQNYITITIQYLESLQGAPADVQLNLAQPLFLQKKASISFIMNSDNAKLTLSQAQQHFALFSGIFEGISWAVLALFVVSVFVHKMIGLELLQGIQIIYFVHIINNKYTSPFSVFMFLANLGYNFKFTQNFNSNISSIKSNIDSNEININNSTIILLCGILIPLMMLGIYSLIALLRTNDKPSGQNINSNIKNISINTKEFIRLSYNRIIFPFSMSSMSLFFLILGTKKTTDNVNVLLNIALVFATISLSLICFAQIRTFFVNFTQKNDGFFGVPKCSKKYTGLYLIFQLIVSMIIVFGYEIDGFSAENYLAILYFIFIVILLIYRPYKSSIHNAGIVFNMCAPFSFLLWCLLRNLDPQLLTQQDQIFANFSIVLIIGLGIIFSLCRLIMEIVLKYKQFGNNNSNQTRIHQQVPEDVLAQNRISISQNQIDSAFQKHQKAFLAKNNKLKHLNQIPSTFFKGDSLTNREINKMIEKKLQLRRQLIKNRQGPADI